jgi:hypothetical protein
VCFFFVFFSRLCEGDGFFSLLLPSKKKSCKNKNCKLRDPLTFISQLFVCLVGFISLYLPHSGGVGTRRSGRRPDKSANREPVKRAPPRTRGMASDSASEDYSYDSGSDYGSESYDASYDSESG